MKPILKIITLSVTIFLFYTCNQEKQNEVNLKKNSIEMKENMPIATKEKHTYEIHGEKVADYYHWMRLSDDQKNSKTPDEQTKAVVSYLQAENAYKDTMMSHLKTLQEDLYTEIIGRIKEDDSSVPYFQNGYFYHTEYKKGLEYGIHTRKKDTLDNEGEILLDENKMAENHDYFNLGTKAISPDNKWMVYGQDTVSRRLFDLRIKNLETGEDFPYSISGANANVIWANDNKTFFYVLKDPNTLLPYKVMRHVVGSDPSEDVEVYTEKDNTFYTAIYKSRSKKYIIIALSHTISAEYHLIDADNPTSASKMFLPREMDHEHFIQHMDNTFYIRTNKDAKNFKLVTCAESNTAISNWKDLIPHREDVLVENFQLFNDFIAVEERIKGIVNIKIIDKKTGDSHHIDFGEDAYFAYITTNKEPSLDYLRLSFTSLTVPFSTMDYYPATKKLEVRKVQEVVGGYDKTQYTSERIYAEARDGAQVPISIVYKKGTPLDGTSPLLLYAYGSYGSSMDPYFSSVRLSLLDRGFVYAIAHIRGGMELGKQWYENGKMLKKKNTFYDFIDCGKFLVEKKYTQPENLYAMGGSAGGLLMGAVINMEPTLFNGVIAAVPFVDVINTMLDESIPLTTGEFHEWGNPKDKTYYDYIKSYSPYDNVEAKAYPSMLVTTGYHDSQVQYWEPAKWVAKLREFKTDTNPLLFHIEMEAGHGGASGRFKRHRETAMEYSFLLDLAGKTNDTKE